jgi:hypothetical protein
VKRSQTHSSHLSNCASLLLTTAYCCEAASDGTATSSPAVVETVLRAGLENYTNRAMISDSPLRDELEEAARREDALAELEEAVGLLRAELSVSNPSRSLPVAT